MGPKTIIPLIRITGDRIELRIGYDPDLNSKLKRIPKFQWDPISKFWKFPNTQLSKISLRRIFGDEIFEYNALPESLEDEMIRRKYSRATRKAYLSVNRILLSFANKPYSMITESDIREFLLWMIKERNAKSLTVRTYASAIRFFYDTVLERKIGKGLITPRKPRKLPELLTKEEVKSLINNTANPKHRALLAIVYSSGLRVSEAVRLKLADFDFNRNLVRIRNAKGNKDRITILSQVAKSHVQDLCIESENQFLFPGQLSGHITIRTAQRIFEIAAKRIHLTRKVSIHSLRHAFATHLVEAGIHLRTIQEMLGHSSSKTTEIYTRITGRNIAKVPSPLDY